VKEGNKMFDNYCYLIFNDKHEVKYIALNDKDLESIKKKYILDYEFEYNYRIIKVKFEYCDTY